MQVMLLLNVQQQDTHDFIPSFMPNAIGMPWPMNLLYLTCGSDLLSTYLILKEFGVHSDQLLQGGIRIIQLHS